MNNRIKNTITGLAIAATVGGLYIRMTTDGAITADLPVSMFFGGYRGADMRNAKGLPAGYDGKKLCCYFPMPFWKSMKIELFNKLPGPAHADCEIGWADRNPYPEASTGVFKVRFNDNVAVKAGEPDFAKRLRGRQQRHDHRRGALDRQGIKLHGANQPGQ